MIRECERVSARGYEWHTTWLYLRDPLLRDSWASEGVTLRVTLHTSFLAQPLAIRPQHQIEVLGPSRAHMTTSVRWPSVARKLPVSDICRRTVDFSSKYQIPISMLIVNRLTWVLLRLTWLKFRITRALFRPKCSLQSAKVKDRMPECLSVVQTN